MIDNNQTALLELIKSSLFGTTPRFPVNTDWEAVRNEAAAQTVVALALPAVPKEYAAKWQEPAAQSTAHYMRALFEQTNLIKLFSDNDIPLVIIKGSAAAVYYPKPQLRTMGDIDFLINEKDFDKARAILDNNGYSFAGDYNDGRDYTYQKGGVVFELHRRYSDLESDIEPILINGMQNTVIRAVNGHSFPMLPDCENGLLLLDHIRHHLFGGLGIRQIIDWAVFADKFLSDDNYNIRFLPILESANLVTFCKVVTKMCKMYFGLPGIIAWCNDADINTVNRLLETVFESGNFGRKNPYEYKPMQSLALNIRKKGLFKVLQVAGIQNFDICKRNKFFRAFAWLFQIFRFIRRGFSALLHGESLNKDIKEESEQAKFYKDLGIKL